jgi:hypothetical protein
MRKVRRCRIRANTKIPFSDHKRERHGQEREGEMNFVRGIKKRK